MKEPVPADRRLHLYQRLVGLAVMAAVAVIITPLVIDFRDGDEPTIRATNIPDMPRGLRTEEIALNPGAPASPAGADQAAARASGPVIRNEPAPPASGPVTEKGPGHDIPQAWAVKVGSFSNEENALNLRDQLRGKGYNAFLDKTTIDGKSMLRLYVGPEIQRERIDQLRERVAKEFNLPEATVVSYE
jgi:DedD protein